MNRVIGKGLSYVVRIYQFSLGTVLGGRCRFYPSCSEYSFQSFRKHGAVKGLVKTIWRILRCNPWNRGGYDPA
jgi:putative membrane protein insertion efficiency factor